MKDYFIKVFRMESTRVLLVISAFSISLSAVRVLYTGRMLFTFMIWNLFLAFVPWFAASIAYIKNVRNPILFTVLIVVWVLFFPNAPYVLTDFIHIGQGSAAPQWFDLLLLLGYGFAGLLYGFTGLAMIEKIVERRTGTKRPWIFSLVMIYVSCFGVYLGRFLRWNSWDAVVNFTDVFRDVFEHMTNPFDYKAAWVFTIIFGTLLNILFWGFKRADLKEI